VILGNDLKIGIPEHQFDARGWGSVLPGDPYFHSPEYKAYLEYFSSGPVVGTADMYESPYFGTFSSGTQGGAADRAYRAYLARVAKERAESAIPTPPIVPPPVAAPPPPLRDVTEVYAAPPAAPAAVVAPPAPALQPAAPVPAASGASLAPLALGAVGLFLLLRAF